MWYVGLDWADTHHDVVVLDEAGQRVGARRFAHSQEYYPAALHLFAKLHQRSSLVFLQTYPTPQAAQATSLEEITATLRTGKHTNPTRAASKIVEKLHRPQLVASAVMVRAKSRLMLSLVKQLLVVIEEIASYDKAISPLFF